MIGYLRGQDVSCKENFPESHTNPFLTKLVRSRWLDIGLFLFYACLWTSTPSRSTDKNAKKELGQYAAMLTEQAWSITHIFSNISEGTAFLLQGVTENDSIKRYKLGSSDSVACQANSFHEGQKSVRTKCLRLNSSLQLGYASIRVFLL